MPDTPASHPESHLTGAGILMPFGIALVIFLLGAVLGGLSRGGNSDARKAERFQRILHRKEALVALEFTELQTAFQGEDPIRVLDRNSERYRELAAAQGIYLFYYQEGQLRFWSDHSIPVPEVWRSRFGRPFNPMRNSDFVSVVRQTDQGQLLGMVLVRTHYPFENKFLENGFQKDFRLDRDVAIEFLEENGSHPVFNADGSYLFSLKFPGEEGPQPDLYLLSLLCYFLSALLGFWVLNRVLVRTRGQSRWWALSLSTVLIGAVAWALLSLGFSGHNAILPLLQPELYASRLFPSMASLLVFTFGALFVALIWYRFGVGRATFKGRLRYIVGLTCVVTATLLLLFAEDLMEGLVLDSSISFEAYRVASFSGYTLLGLFVISAWFLIVGLWVDVGIRHFSWRRSREGWLPFAAVSVTMGLAELAPGRHASLLAWGFMILILLGFLYLHSQRRQQLPISRFLFLVLIVSLFMTLRIQQNNRTNKERERMVELVKLSSEHDPVAEMLFSELTMAMRNDSLLARFLFLPGDAFHIDAVFDRVQRTYFSGYWTKYDLQVAVCRPDDRIYLQPPDDEYRDCYLFFEEMIQREGIRIAASDFYFLDNLNGRISYLAEIPFFRGEDERRVFIELDSKIFSEELGYPELLLDHPEEKAGGTVFSYAKYNRGELFTRDGEYPYRRSASYYTSGDEPFEEIVKENYDHSIYNVDEQNTIIVGSPSVTPVDRLISFSYIFAFNFLLLGISFLLTTLGMSSRAFNWSFRNRIQYSLVLILFLTFALICSGTIYFVIQQYRMKNYDSLRNTMRSVYIELIHKVEFEEDLQHWSTSDYYNLDELLRKFSNVFYTDINLYDSDGLLLATSRSEIFNRQLLSPRMNRQVYENMAYEGASEYIHNEVIGNLEYISAYVPLMNSDNQFLAYLNLPYFTQSDALTKDISNLVVAIINIYLILLMVILLLSVFLADRITQPLQMIQQRIARVSLGQKNEPIRYDRRDEIKGLVEEYNFMLSELDKSAMLLARSERESAWREMAKQIAHEIKNPLTPMKLNVQHLQRMAATDRQDPEVIDRIYQTLIEQIDSLSAIANEFSDFAKMPTAKNARINLVTLLKNLIQLYGSSERARITLDTDAVPSAFIHADKEQLMRVFINMVRNGIQAIRRDGRGPSASSSPRKRGTGAGPLHGQRQGHSRGNPRQAVPAQFHHQIGGDGHGPGHQLQHRPVLRRPDLVRHRGRGGHHLFHRASQNG
ncbi:MAG: histidine kinase dimerization/phospho-acceptor domain-containing protein [Bacteroidales bacterium]